MFLDHQTWDGQHLPQALPLNAVGQWTGQLCSLAEGERGGAEGRRHCCGAVWGAWAAPLSAQELSEGKDACPCQAGGPSSLTFVSSGSLPCCQSTVRL